MDDTLDVATASERRAPYPDADAEIEQTQYAHGHDKEYEGGHLDQRPLGRLVLLQHGAKRRLRYRVSAQVDSGFLWIRHVSNRRVDGERQSANERHQPYERYNPSGAAKASHRVSVQRVADRQIALQRESDDCQHRGVISP